MTNGISIRRLGVEDLDLLCAIPPGLFDNPVDPTQAEAFLNDPLHDVLIAFDGDVAVGIASGTVLLHPDKEPAMFINEVGTRQGRRREGVASALVRAMIDHARKRGCQGVWLGTEADNRAAIALYRNIGAEEAQGYFFGWDDAL